MSSPSKPAYKRVLLKISGEALMGNQGYGIHPEVLDLVAGEIADVSNLGVEVAVVVGPATSSAASRRAAWIARPGTMSACSPP